MIKEEFVETMLQRIPPRFSKESVSLVRQTLHRNPSKRLTVEEVMHEVQVLCDLAGIEGPMNNKLRSRASSLASLASVAGGDGGSGRGSVDSRSSAAASFPKEIEGVTVGTKSNSRRRKKKTAAG